MYLRIKQLFTILKRSCRALAGVCPGFIVAVCLLGLAAASAEGAWPGKGAYEVSIAGGYSTRHNSGTDVDVIGYHLIPRVGYFVTGEHGSGWAAGSLEFLVEPTFINLKHSVNRDIGGLSLIWRWVFSASGRAVPYFELGAGYAYGQHGVNFTTCKQNFLLQGGPGLLIRTSESYALTLGYRFLHISNANTCGRDDANRAINSSMAVLGFGKFF